VKLVRLLLEETLGFEGYLRLISRSYLRLVGMGWGRTKYPELFFLEKLIRPGFVCLDIGANLGYYSVALSRLAGEDGRVLAVEPIPLFQRIWRENVRMSRRANLTLLPFALGAEEGGTVQMGTPTRQGRLHHGMTKITASGAPSEQFAKTYQVPIRQPDRLLADVPRLDFIKCDVEGYEHVVFANMVQTLRRCRPLIQTELNGTANRRAVAELLFGLGYEARVLDAAGTALVPCAPEQLLSPTAPAATGDYYFQLPA
jgi:FkbM family methyltransferase